MKYLSYINQVFADEIKNFDQFVVFGQNVSTGSCLGGLTRNFNNINSCSVLNTPNTENTLVGIGFGLMLGGTPSAFFMKQQDFLLLGVDHLRNTLNIFRQKSQNTSFTIVNITSDSGFEGPQSSLNNLPDFCSISSCEGYTISSKQEANQIIHGCLSRPKFSIISISQRLFHTDIIKLKDLTAKPNSSYFKYLNGKDLVIVCLNF